MQFSTTKSLLLLLSLWLGIAPSLQQQVDEACSTYLNEFVVVEDVQLFRYTVHINTMDSSKSTLMFQYQIAVPDVWIGFGLAETPEKMIGGQVVIGIPNGDNSTVMKYSLGGYLLSDVVPLPESQQTLMDASIEVTDDGLTLMSFTKFLEEDGELFWTGDGINNIIGAVGSSNVLGQHSPEARGGSPFPLSPDCIDGVVVQEAPAEAPTPAPTAETSNAESIVNSVTLLILSLLVLLTK